MIQTPTPGPVDLCKCLSKQESLELRESREIRRIAVSEFWTDGAMKLKERSPTDSRPRLGIFKSFSLEDRIEDYLGSTTNSW